MSDTIETTVLCWCGARFLSESSLISHTQWVHTDWLPGPLLAFAAARGGVCYWCGGPVVTDQGTKHPLSPTREHLVPRAHRGTNAAGNLVLAHRRCNTMRGTMAPDDFRRKMKRGVAEQVDAAGLNPVCPSGRAGSTAAAPTTTQRAAIRDFWSEQNLAEIGGRVRRDLAREERHREHN